jgi:hypothetical protein
MLAAILAVGVTLSGACSCTPDQRRGVGGYCDGNPLGSQCGEPFSHSRQGSGSAFLDKSVQIKNYRFHVMGSPLLLIWLDQFDLVH